MINKKIASGRYNSPTEVVREGLQLLKRKDELRRIEREELKSEVMKGVNQIRNGQSRVYESAEELIDDIKKEARTEFEARKKKGN